VKAAVGSQECG